MRRALAVLLWWAALLLIVGGIVVTVSDVSDTSLAIWIGAGLVALGLNVLLAGDLAIASDTRPISARAEVSRAILHVQADLSNLDVRAGDGDRLAAVHIGRGSSPQILMVDGVAHLHMSNKRRWVPVAANWRADLATNVLWDVNARSLIGHLDIDLRGIRVDTVKLKSKLGDIRLKCPRRGMTHLEVETTLGDIEIEVPQHVGARITVKQRGMGNITVDKLRFEQLDDVTYSTLDVESSGAVAEIILRAQSGEVRLR